MLKKTLLKYKQSVYRKPGHVLSGAPSCKNWWCYNSGSGDISTQLHGSGRARLDYGICYGSSRSANKVTVYLNDVEISKVVGGSVLNTSHVIEFEFNNLDTLKIEESGVSAFQFNNFSVIGCKGKYSRLSDKQGSSLIVTYLRFCHHFLVDFIIDLTPFALQVIKVCKADLSKRWMYLIEKLKI